MSRRHVARSRRWVWFALTLLTIGVVWEILTRLGLWNELLFPSPRSVWQTLQHGLANGSLVAATLMSLKRLLLGYGVSLLIGVPLGLLLSRFQWLDHTLGFLALGLQALPSICWLPLAVLWFGLSETAIQFVVIMGSLMALTLATRDGINALTPMYFRAAQVLGARGWRLYCYVILPAALPSILTGAKLGWSFAWRSLMAAELLYVGVGLGSTLTVGRELHDMALVVAAMLLIITVGLCFDRLVFGSIERVLHARWGTVAQQAN